jgi:DNA-binding HxlR family transcriptional regulator
VINYQPLYDPYNDYLNLLVINGLNCEKLSLSDINKPIRFDSQKIANDKLSFYVSSLICEYKDNIQPEIDMKMDYYKTSLKTILLQIITAMNKIESNHAEKQYYLQ